MDEQNISQRVGQLEQTFNRVQHYVRQELENRRTRLRRGIIFRIVLLVIIFGYLTFLYGKFKSLDSEWLGEWMSGMVRERVDQFLEDAQQVKPGKYKEEFTIKFRESLPKMREQAEGVTQSLIDSLVASYQVDLDLVIKDFFEGYDKVKIATYEDYPEDERIQKILDDAMDDFDRSMRECMDEYTYNARKRLEDINEYLIAALHEPAPTERDRLVRETVLSLVGLLDKMNVYNMILLEEDSDELLKGEEVPEAENKPSK